ncbi:MAG: HigA family addiction module antidote protein [Leptospira sp.]|nr:HigA family addiction module antidote protein [Leptospira sp.]
MKKEKFLNVHPGEILIEEFLMPLEISAYRLAKETGIPESNVSEIINGKRSITAAISIKLGKFFELNSMFWIGLQNDFDIRLESHKLKSKIKDIKSYKELKRKTDKTKKVKSVALSL